MSPWDAHEIRWIGYHRWYLLLALLRIGLLKIEKDHKFYVARVPVDPWFLKLAGTLQDSYGIITIQILALEATSARSEHLRVQSLWTKVVFFPHTLGQQISDNLDKCPWVPVGAPRGKPLIDALVWLPGSSGRKKELAREREKRNNIKINKTFKSIWK